MEKSRKKILITAGPTHEPIDAVRYIANRSSGRLGIALAEESAGRGWQTTLLLGPTHLQPQPLSHLRTLRFRTTADLRMLLHENWPEHDILVMAAAVADYCPASLEASKRQSFVGDPATPLAVSREAPAKIPRTGAELVLRLEPTPDLLAELSTIRRADQTVLGFALEPAERLIDSARAKLDRKQIDAIVANPLETMDSETISATLILKDGRTHPAPINLPKTKFAQWLLDRIADIRM